MSELIFRKKMLYCRVKEYLIKLLTVIFMHNNLLKTTQTVSFVLLFVLFFSFTSCDDNGVLPVFQPSYDMQLGKELSLQISNDTKTYPLLNNASANQYLQNIINEIIKAPEMHYAKTFTYKVEIINSDVINAFAAPGGYIYVYRGLIKYLESEAELAAILAHEIAHIDKRHAVQTIQKQYGVKFLVDLFSSDKSGEVTKFATEMLTNLAFMKNSRDNEFEADEFSFKYLCSTKWYPAAGKDFFERMLKGSQSGQNIFEEMFSTHPTDQDRIDKLNKLIQDKGIAAPNETNLFKEKYKEFKNSI